MGELAIRRNRGFTVPRYQVKTEKQTGSSRSQGVAKAPGFTISETLRQLMGHYQAVICQSFGVGGLPGGGEGPFAQTIGEWLSHSKTFVMMTQVPYEGSDMAVYQVGQQVKEQFPVLEAYNMTMEAAVTKLMWVLGQTGDPEEIKRLFYRPVQHDLIH